MVLQLKTHGSTFRTTETTCKLLQTTYGGTQVGHRRADTLIKNKGTEETVLKRYTAGCHDTLVIPALGRQSQEDPEFEVSLGYIVSSCLKITKWKYSRSQQEYEKNIQPLSEDMQIGYHLTRSQRLLPKGQEINTGEEQGKRNTDAAYRNIS